MKRKNVGDLEAGAAVAAYNSVLRTAIRHGHIDPRGKSQKDIEQELYDWVRAWPEDCQLSVTLDHRPGLLAHARRLRKAGEQHLAIVLFATWSEHWLNALIDTRCMELRISETQTTEIIRSVSLQGKATWLLLLMRAHSIPAQHVRSILEVAELRNGFIHYKWKGFDPDGEGPPEKRLSIACDKFEKAVRYLQKYESRFVLHSSQKRLLKKKSQLVESRKSARLIN